VGDVRLTGVLTGVSPEGLLTYRAAKVTVNDRLGLWIRHLALNAVRPKGVALTSRCIGQDAILTLRPVNDPIGALKELLQLYFAGLVHPLHFFPRSACIYFERGVIDSYVKNTWAPARFADTPPGERDDPYNELAYRGVDPLDEEFERIARTVFGTMKEWLDEEALT
jgi:exodeoxyribonuclease V gamma subunit